MSMRLRISGTWLLRAVAAATAAAMVTAGAAAAGAPAPTPSAPAPPARNYGGPGDFALRERLVRLIGRDPDLRQEKFDLLLANGGAVFKGELKTCALRMRLLRLAALSHGIINVTDDLRVRAGDLPDETLRKAVLDLLEGQREALGLQNLVVTVQDSVATLEGSARDYASRVRAEEVAGTVAGLSRISNHLMPADAPSGSDDRALTSALIAYLGDFRNFGFPAQIKVKVEGGVATLGGRVGLYFARQQAAVLASLVKGIRRADNQIKVDTTLMPRIGTQRPQSVIEAGP